MRSLRQNLIDKSRQRLLPRSLRNELFDPIYYSKVSRILENFGPRVRNFSYKEFVKLLELHIPSDLVTLRYQVSLSFTKMKIVFSSMRWEFGDDYPLQLYKLLLSPQGQESYKTTMDLVLRHKHTSTKSSKNLLSALCDRPSDGWVARMLVDIEPRLWVPVSAGPLFWDEESEGKMALAMNADVPCESMIEKFSKLFESFMDKYAPHVVYCPPVETHMKVGNQRYNDGGEVKRDSEPAVYRASGFLYQRFQTHHLVQREVWLPGKSIKNNNSWWMTFIENFVKKIPYDHNRFDTSEQVHAHLVGKIDKDHIYLDVSGFGLQYPRAYLKVMSSIIAHRYPNEVIDEMTEIFHKILDRVNVQMPDGKFVYPPRGIGLGYYENLKALGMWAIIDQFHPLIAFGDQAIVPLTKGMPLIPWTPITQSLIDLGFTFSKRGKEEIRKGAIIWDGHLYNSDVCIEPRSVWTDIFGAFTQQHHWQRKSALRSVELPREYKHIWMYVGYIYERFFGFEFYPGESLKHPENLGVNQCANLEEGWLKDWKVSQMETPDIQDGECGLLHLLPTGHPPDRKAAAAFSRKRAKEWQNSRPFETAIRDFIRPKIKMNRKKVPSLSRIARATPMWAEKRSVVLLGYSTGKIVSGLNQEEASLAPSRQCLARDPWEARATGGYEILTNWRGIHGPTMENEILARIVNDSRDAFKGLLVYKRNLPNHSYGYNWGESGIYENIHVPKAPNPYWTEHIGSLIKQQFDKEEIDEDPYCDDMGFDFTPLIDDDQERLDYDFFEELVVDNLGDVSMLRSPRASAEPDLNEIMDQIHFESTEETEDQDTFHGWNL